MIHICMICKKSIDLNDPDTVLKQGEFLAGFIHYACQDTFTPEWLGPRQQGEG